MLTTSVRLTSQNSKIKMNLTVSYIIIKTSNERFSSTSWPGKWVPISPQGVIDWPEISGLVGAVTAKSTDLPWCRKRRRTRRRCGRPRRGSGGSWRHRRRRCWSPRPPPYRDCGGPIPGRSHTSSWSSAADRQLPSPPTASKRRSRRRARAGLPFRRRLPSCVLMLNRRSPTVSTDNNIRTIETKYSSTKYSIYGNIWRQYSAIFAKFRQWLPWLP